MLFKCHDITEIKQHLSKFFYQTLFTHTQVMLWMTTFFFLLIKKYYKLVLLLVQYLGNLPTYVPYLIVVSPVNENVNKTIPLFFYLEIGGQI